MKKLLKIIQNFLTYIFLVKVKYTPETYHVTLQFQVEFLSKNKKISLFFFRKIFKYGVSQKAGFATDEKIFVSRSENYDNFRIFLRIQESAT